MHCVDLGASFPTHIYLQNLASIQPRTSPLKFAGSRRPPRAAGWTAERKLMRLLRDARLSCHGIRQTLEGSFSAVSKPNFASKYAFESSRRDLHNALLCTAPKSHFFQKISRICQNLRKFSEILRNSQFFKPIFCENFEIAAVQKDANLVELEKCCRTHIYLQKSVPIQPKTSNVLPKFAKNWQKFDKT